MLVSSLSSSRFFDDDAQYIGIEIEVEGCRRRYAWDRVRSLDWEVISDGSLRDGGNELVSPPLPVEVALKQLPEIYTDIAGSHGHGTVRTGTHVHFDMTSRTLEQVGAILTLYSLVEPWLYAQLPQDREECIYCVPWYRAATEAYRYRAALDAGGRTAASMVLSRACKYTGMNIGSLLNHGTLEFRMAPTFSTPTALAEWIMTLDTIVRLGSLVDSAEAMLDLVANTGLESLWDGASELATKYDAYFVAEILGRNMRITWEAPAFDFDDVERESEELPRPSPFTFSDNLARMAWTTPSEESIRTISELLGE